MVNKSGIHYTTALLPETLAWHFFGFLNIWLLPSRYFSYCLYSVFHSFILRGSCRVPRARLHLLTRNKAGREQRSMTLSKFSRSREVVVPEGEIGMNFFHLSRVFLRPCSLKQAKPRHKNEASPTLSDKAVHTALSFKGLLRSWVLTSFLLLCSVFLKIFSQSQSHIFSCAVGYKVIKRFKLGA